ncbi:MAG: cation transporter [Rubritepida sp.]|nr:cation transporter [Rubritepida sp.]
MNRAVTLAAGSVAVAIAVLALKLVAWRLTGSVALFADALESVVNVAAAVAALVAVRFAAMPADTNHPYGHDKAEYFSAVLEGALILVAAFVILMEVWTNWNAPRDPTLTLFAFVVAVVATLGNAAWSSVLFRHGKRLRSPALLADARHLRSDVITSGGVLIGVALALTTGLIWLDLVLAALTAINILFSGARLVRESVGGLMDEALSPELLAKIRATVAAEAEGAIEAHDIRSRQAGRSTFIEFHLVVPGDMLVVEAHAICDRVEIALKAAVGDAIITIHVEPEGKAKHSGVLVL